MYKTNAIVIGRQELGEADCALDVLTEKFGRLLIVARSVRKITSKLNAHTQLFNESEIVFVDGKRNKVLTSALKLNSFPGIVWSLEKINKASEAAELTGRLILRNSPDEKKIFYLFKAFLGAVERNNENQTELIMRYFEFGLLETLGFGPEFKKCVFCRRKSDSWQVGLVQGGRVCSECLIKEGIEAIEISNEGKMLIEAVALGQKPIKKIKNEAIREVGRLFRLFISYHTNK
jgi:DNA repair protein RecO (recombination protein O)